MRSPIASPIARLCTTFGLGALVAALGLALAPAAAKAAAGDAAKGKVLFEQNCATCHGVDGKGDGPTGQALAAQGIHPRNFTVGDFKFDTDKDGKTGTDQDLFNVITNGAAAYGGSPLMAPWGQLSEQDRWNLIAYIRTFKK
jgi:mono/diheme cytochrome c family protein